MIKTNIVCFGEILWDVLPDGIFLGGAPANVAYHANQLGAVSRVLSRVGDDFLGEEISRRLSRFGVGTELLEKDSTRRTGTVIVNLSAADTPVYDITEEAAWDNISSESARKLSEFRTDAIVYGTLALRSRQNRDVLQGILSSSSAFKVFDVNLRPPYIDLNLAAELANLSDLVKVNSEELEIIAAHIGLEQIAAHVPNRLKNTLQRLSERWNGAAICVTCGKNGSALLSKGEFSHVGAAPANVVSSVGAGDAYLARLIIGILAHEESSRMLNDCARLSAFVVSQNGATPAYEGSEYGAAL